MLMRLNALALVVGVANPGVFTSNSVATIGYVVNTIVVRPAVGGLVACSQMLTGVGSC